MLFYLLGLVTIISAVFFFFRDGDHLFQVDDELSGIQIKILRDESLFVKEQIANQLRLRKGEYISPTLDYVMTKNAVYESHTRV